MTDQPPKMESVTFRDYVEGVKDFIAFVWKKKYYVIGVTLLGGLLLGLKAYVTKPLYNAQITFMVKEEGNSGGAGLSALMGRFGFSNPEAKLNLSKVSAIATSKNIIIKTLMDTVLIDNRLDRLGNFFVEKYNFVESWQEREDELKDFKKFNDPANFSPSEVKALNLLYFMICGEKNKKPLMNIIFSEKSFIITLEMSTPYEQLTYLLITGVYENLQEFYITQSTEKLQVTVNTLEKKLGIAKSKLSKKESSLFQTRDKALGLYMESDALPESTLSRETQLEASVYGETLKNLETARFNLMNATPYFQVIDQPILPIFPSAPSILIFTFLGMLACFIVSVLGVYLAYIYIKS